VNAAACSYASKARRQRDHAFGQRAMTSAGISSIVALMCETQFVLRNFGACGRMSGSAGCAGGVGGRDEDDDQGIAGLLCLNITTNSIYIN
jgi:hypothetical protein